LDPIQAGTRHLCSAPPPETARNSTTVYLVVACIIPLATVGDD
jgi:hypothetical protein